MATVRTYKGQRFWGLLSIGENKIANLTTKGTSAAGVIVYVVMGRGAARTNKRFGNSFSSASGDRFKRLMILPKVVIKKKAPVLLFELLDNG